MNKKLIAVAVAGACIAPAAMAQTANPVTLYGRIFVNFQSVEGKNPTVVRRNRVADHNSFLGVKGTEDLGGGLKAFFQLETVFQADQNDSTFANRNSGVGLQGNWGSVLLGRWDSPMKVTQTAVDPWGDNELADITGAALRQGQFSQRHQNSVQYWSPTFGGFNLRAMYVANENRTATANGSAYGASAAWSGGPLYAALSYEKHKNALIASGSATANSTLVPTAGTNEDGVAGAASYQFGPAKLSGQYGRYKRTGTETQKSWQLGLDWAFGNGHLLASYSESKNGGTTGTAQPSCDLKGLGYRYDFSKRTSFMANYARVENDVGTLCNFGQGSLGITTSGQDVQGFSIGVRHVF
jgi:predicted porin